MTSLMSRRNLLARAAAFGVAAALGGCDALFGKRWSYRYKLTLSLDTPDGVKTGSSVVQITFYTQSFPEQGTFHSVQGEAVYVDLGADRPSLIALLTCFLRGNKPNWWRDAGPGPAFMAGLFGVSADRFHFEKQLDALERYRGSHAIEPANLPDLVTFVNVKDPKSVFLVDPNDLEATFGAGVEWSSIELALTDEPVTSGIEAKLPWVGKISTMLDGAQYTTNNTVANSLSTSSLKWPLP